MPFIGADGLPEWRVTLRLAQDTRPAANPIWVRDGNDVNLTTTGELDAAWARTGTDVDLVTPPGTGQIWATSGTDVNLLTV